jgi:hypothetical protein
VLLVWIVIASSPSASQQSTTPRDSAARSRSNFFKLEEFTWPQIDALDRQQTLFILPVGMIEEHGPICLWVPTHLA